MSSFFDSEFVREEMEEISRMQEEIYARVFQFPTMDKQGKLDHVDKLGELLKKQRVLYTRLCLSDDPAAKRMKENILQSAMELGFPSDINLTHIFANMTKVLESMRERIIDNP
jgi:hypothetical protein